MQMNRTGSNGFPFMGIRPHNSACVFDHRAISTCPAVRFMIHDSTTYVLRDDEYSDNPATPPETLPPGKQRTH